jgi:hypothetical protein
LVMVITALASGNTRCPKRISGTIMYMSQMIVEIAVARRVVATIPTPRRNHENSIGS